MEVNKFKVQELEQRLEMKKWGKSASVGTSTDTYGNTTVNVNASIRF